MIKSKLLTRDGAATALLTTALFLLPWQTRWILQSWTLNGGAWEYGTVGVYAVQILLLVAALLRGRPQLSKRAFDVVRYGFIFLGAVFISTTFALHRPLSILATFHVVMVYVLLVLLLDARTDIRRQLKVFCCGLVLPALLGWWQVLSGTSPASTLFGLAEKQAQTLGVSVVETPLVRMLRAHGPLPHPNIFGGYLATSLLLLFALLVSGGRRVRASWWMFGLTVFFSATLVITFSRSAWLALGVGMATMIGFLWRAGTFTKHKKRIAIFLLAVATGGLFAGIGFRDAVQTRLLAQERLETKSVEERVDQYQYVDDLMRGHWVTGVGVANYTYALHEMIPDRPAWWYQPIHQFWLVFVVEVGVAGAILFFRWMVSIAATIRSATMDVRPFGFGLIGAITMLGFFDHYLWTQWAGLALSVVIFATIVNLCGAACEKP